MRFLDRKWVERKLDDFTQDLYYGVYLRHISELAPDLPPEAQRYAISHPGLLLMGAKLVSADLLNDGANLRLVVESGARLTTEYELANPGAVDLSVLRGAITTLSNEFDYGPQGTFIHRILLYPKGECEVVFTGLTVNLEMPEAPAARQQGQATRDAGQESAPTSKGKSTRKPAATKARKTAGKRGGKASAKPSSKRKSGSTAAKPRKKPLKQPVGKPRARRKKPGAQPPGESA